MVAADIVVADMVAADIVAADMVAATLLRALEPLESHPKVAAGGDGEVRWACEEPHQSLALSST